LKFDGENPVKILHNSEWNDKLSFKDLIEVASNFTAQQMFQRDMFQERIKNEINATQLLEKVVDMNASDLHVSVGAPPYIRVNTVLKPLSEYPVMGVDDVEFVVSQFLDAKQRELLEINKELDFSISLGQKARFRVNAFFQRGYPSVALRHISMNIPTIEELHLPPILNTVCNLKQGLVIVVGPAGQGKSTTIASMIENINKTRSEHIITIEDPIEYVLPINCL